MEAVPPLITADSIYSTLNTGILNTVNNIQGKYNCWKNPVLVATTFSISLNGLQTIDDIALFNNARVLVKNQLDPKENGIYIAKNINWQRSSDLPEGSNASGLVVYVQQGTTNGSSMFNILSNNTSIIVGTDGLNILRLDSSDIITNGGIDGSILVKNDQGFVGYPSLTYYEDSGNDWLYVSENGATAIITSNDNSDLNLNILGYDGNITTVNNNTGSQNISFNTGKQFQIPLTDRVQVSTASAVDSKGNYYISGTYNSALSTIKDLYGLNSGLSFVPTTDIIPYIIKYDFRGNVVSYTVINVNLQYFSDNNYVSQFQLRLDSKDNLYLIGKYSSDIDCTLYNFTNSSLLIDTTFTLPATSGNDISTYIVKWSSDGTILSRTVLEFSGTNPFTRTSCCIDKNDNLYISDTYTSTLNVPVYDINDQNLSVPRFSLLAGSNNIYLIKFTNTGKADSWTVIESIGSTSYHNNFYANNLLASDSQGNVYLTSSYNYVGSATNVYNMSSNTYRGSYSNLQIPVASGPSDVNIFTVRYSSSGIAIANNYINCSSGHPAGIAVDSLDNVYITFSYKNANGISSDILDFGSNSIRFILPYTTGLYSSVVKWNNSGIATGSTTMTGTYVESGSLTVDNLDNVYITGQYGISTMNVYNFNDQGTLVFTLPNYSSPYTMFLIKFTGSTANSYSLLQRSWVYDLKCNISNDIYVILRQDGSPGTYNVYNVSNALTAACQLLKGSSVSNYIIRYYSNGDMWLSQRGNGGNITMNTLSITGTGTISIGTRDAVKAGNISFTSGICTGTSHADITFTNNSLSAPSTYTKLINNNSIYVMMKSNYMMLPKVLVTAANFAAGATIDSKQGHVTITDPSSVAARSAGNIIISNTYVASSSLIKVVVETYAGTGIPIANVVSKSAGSFTVRITNGSGTGLSASPLKFSFIIF